ncbi:MAG: hypothetical protein IPJ62_13960 [Betaproteobacteria bacterium]|nr:hypothetical protein [Betaproteobacteria bacterium]
MLPFTAAAMTLRAVLLYHDPLAATVPPRRADLACSRRATGGAGRRRPDAAKGEVPPPAASLLARGPPEFLGRPGRR